MGNHPLWHLAIDEHLGGWGCTVLHFQLLSTPCKASFKASWEFGMTKTGSLATTFLGCMGWFDRACWNSSWWHSENCSLTMTWLPLFHPWQSQDEFLSLCVSTGGQGQQDRFPEYHFHQFPLSWFETLSTIRINTLPSGSSIVMWQTGQTYLPSLALILSTLRSMSSFHLSRDFVCSLS